LSNTRSSAGSKSACSDCSAIRLVQAKASEGRAEEAEGVRSEMADIDAGMGRSLQQ
jgi:hypothetical protein